MPTDQDYDDAAEALSSPDAPEPVKAAARRLLSALPRAAPDQDQGFGMLAGPSPESESQIKEAEALNPQVAKALQLRAHPAQVAIPGEDALAVSQRRADYRSQYFDESLKTASKRKDLAAPPEFIPPTQATAAPLGFFDIINRTRARLPENFPGGTAQHFHEPGIDQFRAATAPLLGPKVLQLDESSEEYKTYADKLWKEEYAKAVAEGRPVVRESYKANIQPEDKAVHAYELGLGGLGAAAVGADKALAGVPSGMISHLGTGPTVDDFGNVIAEADPAAKSTFKEDRANQQALTGAFPLSSELGFGIGAMSPISPGGIASSAAGGAARRIAPAVTEAMAASGVGRVATGAAHGAIGGAAAQGAGDLTSGNTEGMGGRMADAAALGFPLGAGGAILGELAGAEGTRLRRESPLGSVPKEYGDTSTLSGFKAGPRTEGLRDEARAANIGESNAPDVRSMLADRLEKPMVSEGRRLRAEGEERAGDILAEYEWMNASERHSPEKYLGANIKLHDRLTDAQGNPIARNGPQVAELKRRIAEVADVIAVPKKGGAGQAEFDRRLDSRFNERSARENERLSPRDELQDPFPMKTEEATSPGGRADFGEKTIPDEVTPVGLNDLEMPKGTTVPPPSQAPELWSGNGIAKLKEIQKHTPSAFKVSGQPGRDTRTGQSLAPEVVKMGFDPVAAVARASGIPESQIRSEGGAGNDLLRQYDFIVVPKKYNAGEHRALTEGVNNDVKAGGAVKQDTRLDDGTLLAIHQDRDLFKGSSPGIPKDLKTTIRDEAGNPIDLSGYSARQALNSDELAALKKKLGLAGLPGTIKEELSASEAKTLGSALRQHGTAGRLPGEDAAQRELAAGAAQHGYPEAPKTLDEIKFARAVAELEKSAQITQMFRGFGGAINPTERMSALGLRLRLDPSLQFLSRNAGKIGPAGAAYEQDRQRKAIPPQASQATIDQISRLLGVGP